MKHEDIDHTGLTGAGGSVATDAIWDAAGDLAVGSGANTAARLAIGASNGMILQRAANAVAWGYAPFRGCKVYHSTTQTMNGSGTNSGNTILTFDSEEKDTDGYHAGGTPTKIIIPAGLGGLYHVGFYAYATTSPPSVGTIADLWVDGATPTAHHGFRSASQLAGTGTWAFHISGVLELAAAKELTVNVNNPNASTFTVGHASAAVIQTAFWAYLIGV